MGQLLTITPTSAPWLYGANACLHRFHTLGVLRQYPKIRIASPVLKFANVIHEVLCYLLDPQIPGLPPREDCLDKYLHRAFLQAGYIHDRDFEIARARQICKAYLAYADLQEIEATIAVEIGGVWPISVNGKPLYNLSARLDRVLEMPDGRVIGIDYKTGSQLAPISGILVNLCALKAFRPNAQCYEFWIESLATEPENIERTVFVGSDFRGAVRDLTRDVQRYLAATEYPATANDGCRWCPLLEDCQGKALPVIEVDDLEF